VVLAVPQVAQAPDSLVDQPGQVPGHMMRAQTIKVGD